MHKLKNSSDGVYNCFLSKGYLRRKYHLDFDSFDYFLCRSDDSNCGLRENI